MKKLLVFLVSVLTMALLLTGCGGDTEKKDAAAGGEQQVLNLFSWADNFDPEVIAEFEKQYNCKVTTYLPTMKNFWLKFRPAEHSTM